MKTIIVYTLLFAILLQAVGCYSFYPLEKNESISEYLKQDKRLELRLKNGENIKASLQVEENFISKRYPYDKKNNGRCSHSITFYSSNRML